jgi:D-alanyl-D-alanine carboxypeptidase
MSSRRLLAPLLALAALGLAAPAAEAGPYARANAALKREANRLLNMRNAPPGIAITIHRGNRRIYIAGGRAVVGSSRRWRGNDHTRLASVSKAYNGAVALRLVERGQLKLSDTIGQRLPELPQAWQNVTLRQLLNHTSGLPNYTDDPGLQAQLNRDPHGFTPREKILDYVRNKPLVFPPGSRYAYSNSDNIAVGLMAQRATGRSYERLLSRLVFRPLGLRRTSMQNSFTLPGPYVHGYEIQPGQPPEDISTVLNMSFVWASGAIQSTPLELNSFIRAYGGTRLLGRRARRQQRRWVRGGNSEPPGPGRASAGLALFQYRMKCGTVHGHTGNFPGYTNFAAASPGGTRSVSVSVNSQLNVGGTAGDPLVFNRLRHIFGLASCAAIVPR